MLLAFKGILIKNKNKLRILWKLFCLYLIEIVLAKENANKTMIFQQLTNNLVTFKNSLQVVDVIPDQFLT